MYYIYVIHKYIHTYVVYLYGSISTTVSQVIIKTLRKRQWVVKLIYLVPTTIITVANFAAAQLLITIN